MFKVIMPERLVNAHEAYKKQIAGNNPVGNYTYRMFHGTHVACDATRYYGPAGWKYCAAADCGLCGISQNGNSCGRSKYGGSKYIKIFIWLILIYQINCLKCLFSSIRNVVCQQFSNIFGVL
jgi:hypothetical protein